eukprot:3490667-Ditylum_brightwellii.AAC.1
MPLFAIGSKTCKIIDDVSIGSSIYHHNSTVDMLKIFSPNACESDLKDVKLFYCVDDWKRQVDVHSTGLN